MSLGFLLTLTSLIIVSIILAMSLNLVKGYGGAMVVSHGASMGIGAYVAGVTALRWGWDTSWTILVGAIVAALVGWMFMTAVARLDRDDFILASFALQMAVVDLFMRWTDVTGGAPGLFGVPRPEPFGFTFHDMLPFTALLVVVGALSSAALVYIGRSGYGITLRGIRESPRSVEAVGKNVMATRAVTFGLASGFAGLAGGLYAVTLGIITPLDFDINRSIIIIAFLLVGGLGNMAGAILGAVTLMILPELVRLIDAVPTHLQGPGEQIIYGVVIVIFVWFRPQGLLPEKPILRLRSRGPSHDDLGPDEAEKGVEAHAVAKS